MLELFPDLGHEESCYRELHHRYSKIAQIISARAFWLANI
jgi:hypothetical protein